MHHRHTALKARLKSVWRSLGGRSLSISMAIHAVLLVMACLWVMGTIPPKKKERNVNFMPTGGGGGDITVTERSMQQRHLDFTRRQMERVSAKGIASDIVLPEPFASTPLKSLAQLAAASRSSGLGGEGSGGGKGDGRGKGFGNGTGIGMGKGDGLKNPFGSFEPLESAFSGTFYNLNRSRQGIYRDTRYEGFHRIVNQFVNGGWKESDLAKYQEAPDKLYLTKLYMPVAGAVRAPMAFGQKAEAHPCWTVLYRATVVAPKSGKFRFVGAGDDILVVRFNGRNIFDFGYVQATTPDTQEVRAALAGGAKPPETLGTCPMKPPLSKYRYPSTLDWNQNLGGMAAGPVFEVTEGRSYPMEILIGESQGGLFAASLLIEELGVDYPKSKTGAPVLPLFRTDPTQPRDTVSDNAPPYDPNGPVWKVIKDPDKI